MTGKHWPTICLVFMVVGALATAVGQVAALATGQFARWIEREEQQMAESLAADARAGRTDGAGPGAGMGIAVSFVCCVPLVFPAGYAWIAAWVMWHPITGVRSRIVQVAVHLGWAGWCGGVATFCMVFGAAGELWGPLQWEWPGFWLQSVGSWVSAAGHAAAALWQPVRAAPSAAEVTG
jgi:hypothetical protein